MRKFPLKDDDLTPMIRGHQLTLELARTRGLAKLLNDLHENSGLRQQMKANPNQLLLQREISIPSGATIEFRDLQAEGWELEIKVVEGLYAYINGFNNEKGFYRVQGPQRPPKVVQTS